MVDPFGQVLRSLREVAGYDLGAMATRTNYSKSYICNVEAGRRHPTADFVEACDRVLGTTPLFALLWDLDQEKGNDVRRRAFMTSIGAAAGIIGLSGTSAFAEVVRTGLLDAVSEDEDWQAVIDDYDRRLVINPSAEYGHSLLAQILVAKQVISERGQSRERLRTVAHLGQLYGLWLGNQDEIPSARGWYRTAATLADQSDDTATRLYVRGRTLSRGIYEGYTAQETVSGAERTLAISSRPCPGALEAYSALVHVHALAGNLPNGRDAIIGMRRVVDGLPDSETGKVAGPVQRTAHFNSYLECRIGDLPDAEKAFSEADPLLRPVPVWHADARIYYGRAHVAAGHVDDGIGMALDAIKGLGSSVRVLKVGVRDLLSVVPSQYRSDEFDELKTYAADGPAPWKA